MFMRPFQKVILVFLFFPTLLAAQQGSSGNAPGAQGQGAPCLAGIRMPGCPEPADQQTTEQNQNADLMTMNPQNFLQAIVATTQAQARARAELHADTYAHGQKGPWMLMFHANVLCRSAAIQPAGRRQALLDKLAHAHGAAQVGPGFSRCVRC